MGGITWPVAALMGLTVLGSGFLRGFTGFGFAVFSVPILSVFIPPTTAVPILMGLQVVSGLQTIRGDRQHIAWHSAGPLLAAALITTGLGAFLLAWLSAAALQLAIGLAGLLAVAALSVGKTLPNRPGIGVALGVGAVSGLLNGMSAMGGPPLVVYFLGYAFPPAAARSTMTFLFMVMGGLSLFLFSRLQTVSPDVWVAIPCLFPFLAAGTALGSWRFRRSTDRSYRTVAMAVLVLVGVLSMANGARSLARAPVASSQSGLARP